MKLFILHLLTFLFLGPILQAQTISGVVLDMKGEEPLVGASVYLNGTTLGTFSEVDGGFELPYNPSFNQLVVSYLGYGTITYNLQPEDIHKKLKIIMQAEAEELLTVDIASTRTKAWANNLHRFKTQFIGHSKFARQTKLLNPEVLYFEKDKTTRTLKAFAREPLKIQNEALGYLIEYDLVAFEHQSTTGKMQVLGYTKFSKLEGNKAKTNRWLKNQESSYYGSFAHFVHTLQSNALADSEYEIRKLKRVPNPDRPSDEAIEQARKTLATIAQAKETVLSNAITDSLTNMVSKKRLPRFVALLDKNLYDPEPNIQRFPDRMVLSFDDYWQVIYRGEKQNAVYYDGSSEGNRHQESVISLTTPEAVFDQYGIPTDPLSVLFEGYWPLEKIPYLLPLDYIQGRVR